MATHLTVPNATTRPSLNRSRSSSSPIATRDDNKLQPPKQLSRPGHVRSHSYMSPAETKPKNAATFPELSTEKAPEVSRFHRLHLPGRHHHSISKDEPKPIDRTHSKRHRYTQSEAQQYHKTRDLPQPHLDSDSSVTPTLITTPASPTLEHTNDFAYPTSRGTAIPSLMRMTSSRSHRTHFPVDASTSGGLGIDTKPSLRRRATSDPKSPTVPASQNQLQSAYKSPIELELDRAELLRQATSKNVTEADLKQKDAKIQEGTLELQGRLANTTRAASDLMRRLDDAQETLLRTTESLVDTISSFTNLTDQSSKLIANFSHESKHLDEDTRQRISHFRNSICKKRAKRVEELERRSKAANQKAEELGRRLENCRTIVKNWEERETSKRRAWRGVWVGVLWGLVLIVAAVFAGVASWKATEIVDGGTSDARVRHATVDNGSHDVDVLQNLEIPDDVKEILMDIDERAHDGARPQVSSPVKAEAADADVKEKGDRKEDQRFRLFDEL